MTDRVYQVGKRVGNRLVPSFKIKRTAEGGVRLSDTQGVDNGEVTLVLAHFGREFHSTSGVEASQFRRTFQPGSQDHFDHAVHELPAPFALMRKSK